MTIMDGDDDDDDDDDIDRLADNKAMAWNVANLGAEIIKPSKPRKYEQWTLNGNI